MKIAINNVDSIILVMVLLTTTLPLFADAFSIKPRQNNKLVWVGDSAILECIPVSNKSTVWSFIPYGTDRTRVIFDGERVSDDVTTRYSWKPINNGGGSSLKILSVDSSYAGRYTCQSGHDEVITSTELTTVEKRVGFDNATMKFKVISVGNVKPIVECFETVVNKTHYSNLATFACKVCLDEESAKAAANDCLGELVVKINVTSTHGGMSTIKSGNNSGDDEEENFFMRHKALPAFLVVAFVVALVILLAIVAQRIHRKKKLQAYMSSLDENSKSSVPPHPFEVHVSGRRESCRGLIKNSESESNFKAYFDEKTRRCSTSASTQTE